MTRHLQSEEISRYLVGDLAPELESHAHQCPECKARLVRLEASLAGFRGTVRNFKENEFMTTYKMHTGNETMAGLSSLLIHCGVVAMLLMLGTLKPVQHFMKQSVTLVAPNLKPYEARKSGGGGGGGDRSPLEASQGKLPKVAPRQFTPPRVDAENAKLPMAPTIIAPSDVPNITATNYGDPLGRIGAPSNGTGFSGGIGTGDGGGVGPGSGPGVGPGTGGSVSGGAYRIGGGVSSPVILTKIEPEYSEEARKAKWQGTVELSCVIDATGHARNFKISKALGLGLDEKAMEAVAKWIFKPGMKDGKAVAVFATIQVTFHLL
jgi:TonB family protein